MDNLEQKYRNDNLTPDELKHLREEVNSTSNARLEDSLRETWEAAEASSADVHRLDELKTRIDERIFPTKRVTPLYWKVLRIAAAVLLPLFIIATAYLYQKNTVLSQQDFVASTGSGEQVTISLPDDTQVTVEISGLPAEPVRITDLITNQEYGRSNSGTFRCIFSPYQTACLKFNRETPTRGDK